MRSEGRRILGEKLKNPHKYLVTCGKVAESRVFGRCFRHPLYPALPYVLPLLQYFGTTIAFPPTLLLSLTT